MISKFHLFFLTFIIISCIGNEDVSDKITENINEAKKIKKELGEEYYNKDTLDTLSNDYSFKKPNKIDYVTQKDILGAWCWLGNTDQEMSVESYLKIDRGRQDLIREKDINPMTLYTYRENGVLIEDNDDYKESLKYKIDYQKNKLTIFRFREDTTEHFNVLLLNKTDLILYNSLEKQYSYFVKKSEIFKRFSL